MFMAAVASLLVPHAMYDVALLRRGSSCRLSQAVRCFRYEYVTTLLL